MEQAIIEFAREHSVQLAYGAAWYLLAGLVTALFGRKSRIDAWCEANPGVALVLNFLRATGFDFWKVLAALKTLAESKSKIPTGPAALLLVASLGLASQGCSLEAARQARINSALNAGASGAPVTARPAAECKALDNVHVYTMYGAEVSLGVGTAAGVLAAADTSTKVENAAIGTGIGAAAVAAGLAYWSQKSGAIWTEQCSQ